MSFNPITIRNLGPEDAHVLDRVKPGTFDALDPSRAWAVLATRVNEFVVAMDRGEVVGFAYGTMLMRPDKANEFMLGEIGVHPDYRRQGIGKRMLQRVNELAMDRGCARTLVISDTRESEAFFKAVNGQSCGETVRYDWSLYD